MMGKEIVISLKVIEFFLIARAINRTYANIYRFEYIILVFLYFNHFLLVYSILDIENHAFHPSLAIVSNIFVSPLDKNIYNQILILSASYFRTNVFIQF